MTIYAPGTEETDPKKQNMSLQAIAAAATSAITDIATNTSGIASLVAGPLTSGNVATQADQETGTSTTLAVTPGRQKNHPGHPKAWANVTQSAGTYTLQVSFGVTSINKIGTGVIDITLSTAFSTANYAAIGMLEESTTDRKISGVIGSKTVTNYRVDIRNAAGTNADLGFSVAFFGDQ